MAGIDELLPNHPMSPQQHVLAHPKSNDDSKEENEYYEGSEYVYLPSRGVFYNNEFRGLEKIKVRPLDYTDEDILTTRSYYEDGSIFTELLKNTIIDVNKFKPSNLVAVDRDTILLWLRSTSFGNKFEVEYNCPSCKFGDGKKSGPALLIWKIDELEIPAYSDEVHEELMKDGCITISTPIKKVKVKITSPSIAIQTQLEKRFQLKKQNEKIKKDFFATTTLLSIVQGVEVSENVWKYGKDEIDAYFKKVKLPISDSRHILFEARKLNLKYNTEQNFVCPDCGYIEEGVEMPILHKNFFWPESR